jgi:hypothetical protein
VFGFSSLFDLRSPFKSCQSLAAKRITASNLLRPSFLPGTPRAISLLESVPMLILLIILILVFGFGGYRLGPGLGYYGGGGLVTILLILLILKLLGVI